jgi:glutamate-1-semialdehyde 2,1-aminomutase
LVRRDYGPLLAELERAYTEYAPRSAALHHRAQAHLVDGGSHTLRLVRPFPPRIVTARGAWLRDEDEHTILDFWQGHLANILGHNPEVVTTALAGALAEGWGLQTGFTDRLQAETAEILCRQTGAERVRFTTSGALATMYTILLARAFTGRDLVVKVGGGWHGAQPWALKGITFHAGSGRGFERVESEGLPAAIVGEIVVTGFNDPDRLRDLLHRLGDRVACFIVEPFIGVGGFVPASREYLHAARELTQQYGALLIFDEVIGGFRFRAGDLGALYGLQPDLATFGKIIGGGMPLAAVAGRADVLALTGRASGPRVKFSGGTYSAHPASLLAARTLLAHLVAHEQEIYPRLAGLGARVRQALETAFAQEGIYARCTGEDDGLYGGSSLFMLHFPYRQDTALDRPENLFDPSLCDVALSHQVLDLALLLQDVFVIHSHGAVSAAHSEAEIDRLGRACRQVARRINRHVNVP